MDDHKTMVVFRVYTRSDGFANCIPPHVVALFPCQEEQGVCACYDNVSQHGDADYCAVIELTRVATPEEAMDLADELKELGYRLSSRRRAPSSSYRRKWLAMGNK